MLSEELTLENQEVLKVTEHIPMLNVNLQNVGRLLMRRKGERSLRVDENLFMDTEVIEQEVRILVKEVEQVHHLLETRNVDLLFHIESIYRTSLVASHSLESLITSIQEMQRCFLGYHKLPLSLNNGNQEVLIFFNFNLKIGIVFEFKSTSTDLAGAVNGNPALGTVIMATEYNVYNGTFDSKQQMENYEFANSCKPSVNMYHQVECAKKETATMGGVLYVSPVNGVPTQSPQSAITGQAGDLRLYYLGLFQAATVGMQSNGSNIGELWVSYEIEFLKPKIVVGAPNNGAAGGSMDHFAWSALTTNNIGQVATTGILQTAPFGSGTVVQKPTYYSNLGGIVTATAIANAVPALNGQGVATGALATSNANAYYFNPGISRGLYMIQYNAVYGTPAGAAGNFQAVLTNCAMFDLTQDNTLPANQVQTQTNLAGTTTLSSNVTMFIQVTAANASFTLTGTAGSTVPTYADLYVMQMPFEMN